MYAIRSYYAGLLRFHEADVEFDPRIAFTVAAQHQRQSVQADMVAGGHRQSSRDLAGEVAQLPPDVGQLVDDPLRPRQQVAAGLGQQHLAAGPVEEAGGQLLLQAGDALADGGLGEEEVFGRLGEGALAGHLDKGAQAGEISYNFV